MFNEEQRIDNLVKTTYDYAEKIRKLKQENYELKQRVAKFEKPKKKRKFRVMTISEWCDPKKCPKCEYHYGAFYCVYSDFNGINKGRENSKPYKKRNGKYILVEVTNDA